MDKGLAYRRGYGYHLRHEVSCAYCIRNVNVDQIKILGLQYLPTFTEIVTFVCPYCGRTVNSRRT